MFIDIPEGLRIALYVTLINEDVLNGTYSDLRSALKAKNWFLYEYRQMVRDARRAGYAVESLDTQGDLRARRTRLETLYQGVLAKNC